MSASSASSPPLADHDLEGFRRTQALAYECAETVAATLDEGVTEKAVAAQMREWLADHGVREWFHKPFAWFGDRTAFARFRTDLAFFPTNRRLAVDTPVILDVAPVLDGYQADIGYATAFGDVPLLERMLDDLAAYRALIVDGVNRGETLAEVYRRLDEAIAADGYHNRHQRYPGHVLAHRVGRVGGPAPGRVERTTVAGFGVPSIRFLASELAAFRRGATQHSPLWNRSKASEHEATPGLWAVEPHIGFHGVGAKFEELLVIDDRGARWLDDDLPHVRRWRERQVVAA